MKPGDASQLAISSEQSPSGVSGASYNVSAARKPPTGKLVEDDGGVRFMDSPLLGTVYDELKAMRALIDDDSINDSSPQSIDNLDEELDLLSGGFDPPGLSLEDLQPSPAHIFRLWQVYTERVNPLTKIIHVPSVQPYLVEAAANPAKLPNNIQALLFSIYTLATVSMTADECQSLFGCSRDDALRRFSSGTHLALNQAEFLRNHDLETLQALLIYLVALALSQECTKMLTGES